MTKKEFLNQIRERLLASGMAISHCDENCRIIAKKIQNLSTEEEKSELTGEKINTIVERLTSNGSSEMSKASSVTEDAGSEKEVESVETTDSTPTIVMSPSASQNNAKSSGGITLEPESQTDDVIYVHRQDESKKVSSKRKLPGMIDDSIMKEGSKNPKLLFAAILALCAPAILFVIVAVLGISLLAAVLMACVILGMVCGIAVIVCGGSILSVLGFIYGISQIISEPRYVGLHEIGLAMVFAGATIFISVLMYNAAVRLIPFLYKLIGSGLRKWFKKTKELAKLAWKECENL